MDLEMVAMRLIHIGLGVFWAGAIFFIVLFLEPSVRAAGPDGARVMQGLQQRRSDSIPTGWLRASASASPRGR